MIVPGDATHRSSIIAMLHIMVTGKLKILIADTSLLILLDANIYIYIYIYMLNASPEAYSIRHSAVPSENLGCQPALFSNHLDLEKRLS